MDKRDLIKLLERISLTGPGSTDKIKRVLKELIEKCLSDKDNPDASDDSDGSMGEPEELVIAKALNDLNSRLEALENSPSPSQPAPLIVEVSDITGSNYVSTAVFAEMNEAFSSGQRIYAHSDSDNLYSEILFMEGDKFFFISSSITNGDIGSIEEG